MSIDFLMCQKSCGEWRSSPELWSSSTWFLKMFINQSPYRWDSAHSATRMQPVTVFSSNEVFLGANRMNKKAVDMTASPAHLATSFVHHARTRIPAVTA